MKITAKMFKALSDETRLRILNILLMRECCVCEVMSALDISQTRASRNLNQLYDAGLLTMTREGQWSLYSANKSKASPLVTCLLHNIESMLKNDEQASYDRYNLQSIQRVITGNSCCAKKEQAAEDQFVWILNEMVKPGRKS